MHVQAVVLNVDLWQICFQNDMSNAQTKCFVSTLSQRTAEHFCHAQTQEQRDFLRLFVQYICADCRCTRLSLIATLETPGSIAIAQSPHFTTKKACICMYIDPPGRISAATRFQPCGVYHYAPSLLTYTGKILLS